MGQLDLSSWKELTGVPDSFLYFASLRTELRYIALSGLESFILSLTRMPEWAAQVLLILYLNPESQIFHVPKALP